MVTATKQDSEPDKKSSILEAAEEVFFQKGFSKAKIPEMRLKPYVDALDETFQVISPLRKIRRFIKHHFWLHLLNRNFLRVFLLDVQLNKRFYGSNAFKLFQTQRNTIEDIIAEGKSQKCFRADINPRVFGNRFLGAFSHMALRWLIVEKGERYDKMKEIE